MKLRAALLSSAVLFLTVATLFFYGQLMFYQQHIAAYHAQAALYRAQAMITIAQKFKLTENQTLHFNMGECTLKQGYFQVKLAGGQKLRYKATDY